jgi:hypothetical protein
MNFPIGFAFRDHETGHIFQVVDSEGHVRDLDADPGSPTLQAAAGEDGTFEVEGAAHQETPDRAAARPLPPGERAVTSVFGPSLEQSEAEYRHEHGTTASGWGPTLGQSEAAYRAGHEAHRDTEAGDRDREPGGGADPDPEPAREQEADWEAEAG